MAFRARDEARFYTIDGEQYPSVTTIIKCLDKPALVPWASKMQREADALTAMEAATPKEAAALILKSGNAAYDATTKASDIGSEAHNLVEWYLKGSTAGKRPPASDKAENCFESWLQWWTGAGFEAVGIETVVHSYRYGYAGRIDLLARWRTKLYVIDWKSGKDIYAEAHLQNIAYCEALEEMGMGTISGGAMLLLAKDGGKVKVVPRRKDIAISDFLDVFAAWKVLRKMNNQPTGEKA